jgi:predicted DNA-binding helix-hairpin-helix protein
MRQVSRAIAEGRFARAGQTTQLVVGAAGEADREVARAAAWAYGEMGLARVYYSAMQPVPGTPVANRPPVPFGREHRLYQVSVIVSSRDAPRQQGCRRSEVPPMEGGRLIAAA